MPPFGGSSIGGSSASESFSHAEFGQSAAERAAEASRATEAAEMSQRLWTAGAVLGASKQGDTGVGPSGTTSKETGVSPVGTFENALAKLPDPSGDQSKLITLAQSQFNNFNQHAKGEVQDYELMSTIMDPSKSLLTKQAAALIYRREMTHPESLGNSLGLVTRDDLNCWRSDLDLATSPRAQRNTVLEYMGIGASGLGAVAAVSCALTGGMWETRALRIATILGVGAFSAIGAAAGFGLAHGEIRWAKDRIKDLR